MEEDKNSSRDILDEVLSELGKIRLQNNTIVTQNTEIMKEINDIKNDFENMKAIISKCQNDIVSIVKDQDKFNKVPC